MFPLLPAEGKTLTLLAWTPEDIKDRANKPMTNRNERISPPLVPEMVAPDHFLRFLIGNQSSVIGGFPTRLPPLLKQGRSPTTLDQVMKRQGLQRAGLHGAEKQESVIAPAPFHDCLGLPTGGTAAPVEIDLSGEEVCFLTTSSLLTHLYEEWIFD